MSGWKKVNKKREKDIPENRSDNTLPSGKPLKILKNSGQSAHDRAQI